MVLVKENIYQKAEELTEKGYTELNKTGKFVDCDCIAVVDDTRNFWFTTEEVFNETIKKSEL
jgi:hypothetical protein